MQSFFRVPTGKLPGQKILVLINCSPQISHRFYSGAFSPTLRKSKDEFIFLRNEALKKYGLSDLDLIWPKSVGVTGNVDYTKKNPKSIRQMYGQADLSKIPIFQGGFINFGYWQNPFFDNEKITAEQRIASSKEMYRVVGDLAEILKEHNILEVGCGLGHGSSFLSQHYQPKLVVGVDISPDQIARAKKHQISGIESGKLRFTIGEAESMPFTDGSFDCVLSVEAAQHFVSISSFSKEVSRILKPGGKLVMTSFFPTGKDGVDALGAIIPDYHIHGSQNTIDQVGEELSKHMENVRVNSIGKNVWHGFSKWLDQIGYHNQWSKIWPALYEKRLIDYIIYQAKVPKAELAVNFYEKGR